MMTLYVWSWLLIAVALINLFALAMANAHRFLSYYRRYGITKTCKKVDQAKPLKCKNGHEIPEKWAFQSYGAVYQGGVCPVCGVLAQGKFLGNLWTGAEETGSTILLTNCDYSRFEQAGWVFRSLEKSGGTKIELERWCEKCEGPVGSKDIYCPDCGSETVPVKQN